MARGFSIFFISENQSHGQETRKGHKLPMSEMKGDITAVYRH